MSERQFSHYVYDTLHITFYDDVEPFMFCGLVFNNQLHSRKNNSKIFVYFRVCQTTAAIALNIYIYIYIYILLVILGGAIACTFSYSIYTTVVYAVHSE